MHLMRKVGIKALKNQLSKHIRAVAAGETILVTDRDRTVAELRPPSAPEDEGDEAARNWARLSWTRDTGCGVTPRRCRMASAGTRFSGGGAASSNSTRTAMASR